jgi:hypothetical protein
VEVYRSLPSSLFGAVCEFLLPSEAQAVLCVPEIKPVRDCVWNQILRTMASTCELNMAQFTQFVFGTPVAGLSAAEAAEKALFLQSHYDFQCALERRFRRALPASGTLTEVDAKSLHTIKRAVVKLPSTVVTEIETSK